MYHENMKHAINRIKELEAQKRALLCKTYSLQKQRQADANTILYLRAQLASELRSA